MAEGTVLQKNPISRLQEILQQWKYPLPVYREAQGNYQEFGTEVSLTLDSWMTNATPSLAWPGPRRPAKLTRHRGLLTSSHSTSQTCWNHHHCRCFSACHVQQICVRSKSNFIVMFTVVFSCLQEVDESYGITTNMEERCNQQSN